MSNRKQVLIVGGIATGLSMGIPLSTMMRALAAEAERPARKLSEEDHARIEAARVKQERKAAKKAAQRA